jgi:hypothetical protein
MITQSSFWLTIFPAFVGGGIFLKSIELLIAWIKERREQKSAKTTHEKDRPRFRVDITMGPNITGSYVIAKILSLGSLPLTIKNGEIFIDTSERPERVESYKFDGREIGPFSPIEFNFSFPQKLVSPQSGGKPTVKLICQFSYGDNDDEYRQEKIYNRNIRDFE